VAAAKAVIGVSIVTLFPRTSTVCEAVFLIVRVILTFPGFAGDLFRRNRFSVKSIGDGDGERRFFLRRALVIDVFAGVIGAEHPAQRIARPDRRLVRFHILDVRKIRPVGDPLRTVSGVQPVGNDRALCISGLVEADIDGFVLPRGSGARESGARGRKGEDPCQSDTSGPAEFFQRLFFQLEFLRSL
jgi:hypothetical protein